MFVAQAIILTPRPYNAVIYEREPGNRNTIIVRLVPQREGRGFGMGSDLSRHFSERAKEMRASEVRELLKLLEVPDMFSFAGGFPNPETFPADVIREIANDVLKRDGAKALQYGITEGCPQLRESVAERMTKKGIDVAKDDVLIVSGSQQVIDLAGKIFIDPKDTVVISAPTYLTALTGWAV